MLTHYRQAMPCSETEKNSLEELISALMSQSKKYHPSRNLIFNNLGIFQKLKIAYFNGKKSFQFLLS